MKKWGDIRGPISDVYRRAGFDVAWAGLRLIKKKVSEQAKGDSGNNLLRPKIIPNNLDGAKLPAHRTDLIRAWLTVLTVRLGLWRINR
jgi:hypothetical protein